MKKINLKGISEILSEKEMKNVMGGSGDGKCCFSPFYNGSQMMSCPDAATCSRDAGPGGWWGCNCSSCNC